MSRFLTKSRAGIVSLALGAGVAGSLALAPASFAAAPQPPTAGSNCAQDGKINGAGSTFQANALEAGYIYGYQQDVCGPQPISTNLNAAYGGVDPSDGSFGSPAKTVFGEVAYNYSLNGTAAKNGSGAGINRMICRTDNFAGTDLPYNNTQLTNMDSAPGTGIISGSTTGCSTGASPALNTAAVPPPFGPQTSVGYPNTNDATANVMSFPVGAGAVAFAINLNNGTAPGGGTVKCTNGTPSSIDLTADELDKIWQGTINQWDDNELVATNPILATDGCTGPITRVVRFDNSGTTAITMFTLYGIDANPLCSTTNGNWYAIATSSSNNNQWPTGAGCAEGVGTWGSGQTNQSTANPNAAAPAAVTAGSNGSPALISSLESTPGGIGYAETGLWGTLPSGVSFASVQTYNDEQTAGNGLSNATPAADAAGKTFVGAGAAGQQSSCSLPASVPTGATAADGVGLGSPTWSNSISGTTPGKQDIAWSAEGDGYPACGLTFDLVYKGDANETGEIAAPATSGTATAGCTISAADEAKATSAVENVSTTVVGSTNAAGSLVVASVAGFPPTGTINIAGTGDFAYTAVNSGTDTITGSTIPADVANGTAVALTNLAGSLQVPSAGGFPATGVLLINGTQYTYSAVNYTTNTFTIASFPADFTLSNAGDAVSLYQTTAVAPASGAGIAGSCLTVAGPMEGSTNDQVRTLYSFFTYMFSPLAQNIVGGDNYLPSQTLDPLPLAWGQELTQGFQQNY